MIQPAWLADLLAAVVIAIALFSAFRLARFRGRRAGEVDADGVHVLMGVAMAGMLVPSLKFAPAGAWAVVFVISGAWFAWRSAAVRAERAGRGGPRWAARLSRSDTCCEYPLPHLIDCGAMLYMLLAIPAAGAVAAGGSGGMGMSVGGMSGGARAPALGLLLAVGICAYAIWLTDRIHLLAPARALAGAGAGAGTGGEVAGGATAAPVRALLAPRAATCCKIAMGVAMGVMLIDML
jgi:hypothetical protein